MQTLQQWLDDQRSRRYKHAVYADLETFNQELNALSEMFRQDLLTENEYDKRVKILDKRHEERNGALRVILESKSLITDIPVVRVALEILSWSALFVLAGFLLHPGWVDANLAKMLMIGCVAGIATSYLRNPWRRSAP